MSPFIIQNSYNDLNYYLVAIIFYIGCCSGSFSHSYANGIIKSYNILRRSACDKCNRKLYWFHLFPVLSFLFLKGRCFFCKTKIKTELLLFELIFGILFVFYFTFLDLLNALFFSLLLIFLGSIFETDRKLFLIHSPTILIIFFISVLYNYIILNNINLDIEIVLLFFFGWFLIFSLSYFYYIIRKIHGFGGGDKWLLACISPLFSYIDIMYIFLLSCIFASIISILFFLDDNKIINKKIPFGSYICLTTILYPLFY